MKVESFKTYSNEETAKILGIAKQTLHNLRHHRKGPNYYRIGRLIRYREEDIAEYLNNRRVVLEK